MRKNDAEKTMTRTAIFILLLVAAVLIAATSMASLIKPHQSVTLTEQHTVNLFPDNMKWLDNCFSGIANNIPRMPPIVTDGGNIGIGFQAFTGNGQCNFVIGNKAFIPTGHNFMFNLNNKICGDIRTGKRLPCPKR